MKVVSSFKVIVSVFACLFSFTINAEYIVPQPTIEVFRPRGLRVSIPDEDGIRLFAFHGVVNRHLNGLEAGDLSKDIIEKHDGLWVYENRKLRLNLGDALHFWLFVIKNNLGYRLDDQSFIVTESRDAPPGFIKNNKHKTTPIPNHETSNAQSINPQYPPPPSFTQSQCVCPLQPIAIIPPTCDLPSEIHASTTEQPLQSTTPFLLSENVNIWRELLVNFSNENAHLRSQLVEIQEDKTYLVNKLESIGDVNINKLVITGKTLNSDSEIIQVETVLREKLGIDNFNIVRKAVLGQNGTIIFELNTLEDKLHVLRKAKEKLTNSKIGIEDLK